jgi:6-phosphogluconolactonase (cycloisomerase 2 family)
MRRLIVMATVLAAAVGVSMQAQGARQDWRHVVGAVYTATNDAAGNAIVALDRGPRGALTFDDTYPTGGLGSGDGLGNQGALRMTTDGQFLLVVNAGSNSVSVLEIEDDGLVLRDTASSRGVRPVSLAVSGRLVYVLNAGGDAGDTDSLVGFRLSRRGQLRAIPGSKRLLSAGSTGPAQVEISPNGDTLVVTEKATNKIDVFEVDDTGRLTGAVAYDSAGPTPFGFAFGKRNQFFVSEAFGGATDASAISSYRVRRTGQLQIINPSVPTTETAACWVVVTGNGRFLYTTNAGSASISGYRIRPDGAITLLDADGVTASTPPGPLDMGLSGNSRYLYALHADAGLVSSFRVQEQGHLLPLGVATVPVGSNGLAVR